MNIVKLILIIITALPASLNAKRIVVLGPELAKTFYDLGFKEQIVCYAEPLSADVEFKNAKSVGLYYRPNLEQIVACKPDVVYTTFSGTPPWLHQKLSSLGINVILYKATSLDDVQTFINKIVVDFKVEVPANFKNIKSNCVENKNKKLVVFMVGLNPFYVAGKKSFINNVLECAGFYTNVKGLYTKVSAENIIKYNPEIIFIDSKTDKKSSDYLILKTKFGEKIKEVNADILFQASTGIVQGIKTLKDYL